MLQELKGGLRYAKGEPAIIALTILASLTSVLGLPLLTFLPVFARDIFHGDVNRFTHMMAFSGAGAVCGALITAWLGRFRHMGWAVLAVNGVLILVVAIYVLVKSHGVREL
jgi:predicted MFS family arabinose efflux permease